MAPPANPKGGNGFAARMQRKVGPFPVWAWAALILAAGYLLYRRRSSTGPAAPAPAPQATDTSSAQSPGMVGSGSDMSAGQSGLSPSDLAALEGSIGGGFDALNQQLLAATAQYASGIDYGGAPSGYSTGGAAAQPSSGQVIGGVATSPPSVNTGPGGAYSTYYYKQGVTVTPENVIIPPTVQYSSPTKATTDTVTGPSIFAFK